MKKREKKRRGGFTLLEVLLVLIILGVIAAMVVPRLFGTQERANVKATQLSIHGLEKTLDLYAMEHDATYPQSLEELLEPMDREGNAMKPYLREYPKDAWREPLNYKVEVDQSSAGSSMARIWSSGPNKQDEDGSGDDITNWDDRRT